MRLRTGRTRSIAPLCRSARHAGREGVGNCGAERSGRAGLGHAELDVVDEEHEEEGPGGERVGAPGCVRRKVGEVGPWLAGECQDGRTSRSCDDSVSSRRCHSEKCCMKTGRAPIKAPCFPGRRQVGSWRDGQWQRKNLMIVEIKKAQVNGNLKDGEVAFVVFPEGLCAAGACGKLRRLLYGMRPVPNALGQDHSEKLGEFGMANGVFASTVFHGADRGSRRVVHWGDFMILGWQRDSDVAAAFLVRRYDLEVHGVLGGDDLEGNDIMILSWRLLWCGNAMRKEANERHTENICDEMGIGDHSAKGGGTSRSSARRASRTAAISPRARPPGSGRWLRPQLIPRRTAPISSAG